MISLGTQIAIPSPKCSISFITFFNCYLVIDTYLIKLNNLVTIT